MERFGPIYTAPSVSHRGIPDRKPPDKTNENAGPVSAGTGVERKSHSQRLHSNKRSNILLNRQADCREAAAFDGGAKLRLKAKNQENIHSANAGSVRERVSYRDDNHWQSIGSIIDRLLVKGGAA
jgi:hypothetical protein